MPTKKKKDEDKKTEDLGSIEPNWKPRGVWDTLKEISVNEHTEKKNGLTYLSWAWAWGVLKDYYPDATFDKVIQPSGLPYIKDDQGFAYVQVTVTAGNDIVTELFPVTNYANKPIQNPNSFDVNTAHQRCLAKAIAYLGLGHYIYAGEDMPQSSPSEVVKGPVSTEVKANEFSVPKPKKKILTMIGDVAIQQGDAFPFISGPDGKRVDNTGWPMVSESFGSLLSLVENTENLTNFWKANQKTLDQLRNASPKLYEETIALFSKRKTELKGESA